MKIRTSLFAIICTGALCGLPANAAISLVDGVPYSQNFDTLANTGTSSTLPPDWAIAESGTGANANYTAGAGSSTAGDTYSFGTGTNTDRALGGLLSGSVNPSWGASFTNNVGVGTIDLSIAYVGEQWRLGATGRADRIDFQYSTNATSLITGTWVDFNTLDFTAPTTIGTVGPLDGNATANKTSLSATITGVVVANGSNFWIRWTDFNPSGSDDGLGIDNFSITAVPEPNLPAVLGSLGLFGILRRRR